MTGATYPKNLLPVISDAPVADPAFEAVCEEFLVDYGYQTARAYLSDLSSFAYWCRAQKPPLQPLQATAQSIEAHLREMMQNGYSFNTVTRHLSTLRLLFDLLATEAAPNPARQLSRVKQE